MVNEVSKAQEFQVPFGDVDMNGEMFRSIYIARAEDLVHEFWHRRTSSEADPLFTISKATCAFRSALKLGDTVRTAVSVSKIGGRTAGFKVNMIRGNEQVAEIELIWTACDRESREPVALPEELRDWLYQYLD